MKFKEFLLASCQQVDACLEEILPPAAGQTAVLFEAMRYSIFAGGKRLRPCLFLATMEALGKKGKPYLPFAAALEMIHTYSLIHDDLPAMDNDDYRRGKLTCHKVFGEAQAILAGDALLTYAFNAMLRVRPIAPPAQLLAAMDEVAYSAGIKGMIVGQVADIAWEGRSLTLPELEFIDKHKTGALFQASILSAALLAEANATEMNALKEYALQIGLAFQIADDILDVIGDEKKLGKPIGSDAKNQKSTYASLFGLEKAQELAQQALMAAQTALAPLGEKAALLREAPEFFVNRES